jgi:hypothetical protein
VLEGLHGAHIALALARAELGLDLLALFGYEVVDKFLLPWEQELQYLALGERLSSVLDISAHLLFKGKSEDDLEVLSLRHEGALREILVIVLELIKGVQLGKKDPD